MKAKKLRALSIIAPFAIISLTAIFAVGFIGSAHPAKANVLYLHDQAGPVGEMLLGDTGDLLMAMAYAREYPASDQEVGRTARETVGLMCSMAHHEAREDGDHPVSAEIQARARQDRDTGHKCYAAVTAALRITHEDLRNLIDLPFAGPQTPPVSLSNYVLAAIDLIESEPSFSRYLDPEPISRDGLVHSRGEHGYSGRMIWALANLAAGFSEAGQLPEVRQAAERALVWLIVAGPDEDFDEGDDERLEREMSRRNFRADLTGWSWNDPVLPGLVAAVPPHQHAANWLICLYSRVGWGYIYELKASASGLIRVATIRLKDADGVGPNAALVSEATRFIQHMGLIQKIALSDGPTGLPVADKIYLRETLEGQIARIRADDSPENRRFIQIYDDYMSVELDCNGNQSGEQ